MNLDKDLKPSFQFGPATPSKPEEVKAHAADLLTPYKLPADSFVSTRASGLLGEVLEEGDTTKRLRGVHLMEQALEATGDLLSHPEYANDQELVKKLLPNRAQLAQFMAGPTAEEKDSLKISSMFNLPAESAVGKYAISQFKRIDVLTSDKEEQDQLHRILVNRLDKQMLKDPTDEAAIAKLGLIGMDDLKQARLAIGQQKLQVAQWAEKAKAAALPGTPPTMEEFAKMWDFKNMRPASSEDAMLGRSTLLKNNVRMLSQKDYEALQAQNTVMPFLDQLKAMIQGGAINAESIPRQVLQAIAAGQPIGVPLDPAIAPYVGMLGLASRYIYRAVTTDVGNISGSEATAGFAALGGPGFSKESALAQLENIRDLVREQGHIMQAIYTGNKYDAESFIRRQEQRQRNPSAGGPVNFTPYGPPTAPAQLP